MKTILVLISTLFSIYSLTAQNLKESDVPSPVKTKFHSLYPAVKSVEWEKEKKNFEATFKENSMETSVLIDASGKLKETEVQIPVTDLPQACNDYLAKNIPGKKTKDAYKITKAKGRITYEAETEEGDYIFDSNGNFLNKEGDISHDED